eukprot:05419.XXX_148718_149321_1 [CDS] Oithona nana genome sequencing.
MKFTAIYFIIGLLILSRKIEATVTTNESLCPYMNETNAPVLCLLWGKVKVATEVENSAKGKGNEASLPPESYKIPTADELSELIHVDNSLDELRDLTTMQLAERQEESL